MKENKKYNQLIEDGKKIFAEAGKYKYETEKKAFLEGAEFAANLLGAHNFKELK